MLKVAKVRLKDQQQRFTKGVGGVRWVELDLGSHTGPKRFESDSDYGTQI